MMPLDAFVLTHGSTRLGRHARESWHPVTPGFSFGFLPCLNQNAVVTESPGLNIKPGDDALRTTAGKKIALDSNIDDD
jgi:hypothetical protein